MATLKQRLHKKNSSGTYDTVYLETSASMVLMEDGTTAQAAITGKAASSHNHAASNITSGTLGVARGGTGKASWTANRLVYPSASTTMAQLAFPSVAGSVLRQGTSGAPYWTSMDDLKTALGVSSSGGESGGSGATSGSTTAGGTMTFDNMSWIVVDNGAYNSNERVLILKDIWTLDSYWNMNSWCWYFYHFVLSAEARAKLTSHTDKTNAISRKMFPVFLPSYNECNGGFTYFSSNANRIANYNGSAKQWWTRSPYSGYGTEYYVKTDGGLTYNNPSILYGFRPCVALAI